MDGDKCAAVLAECQYGSDIPTPWREIVADVIQDLQLENENLSHINSLDALYGRSDTMTDAEWYIVLRERKQQLEDLAEKVKDELKRLGEQITEEWLQHGQESVKVRGRTLYLRNDLSVSVLPEYKQAFPRAIAAMGQEHMLTVNSKTLQAYIKGLQQPGENDGLSIEECIPPAIRGMLKVTPFTELRSRKA